MWSPVGAMHESSLSARHRPGVRGRAAPPRSALRRRELYPLTLLGVTWVALLGHVAATLLTQPPQTHQAELSGTLLWVPALLVTHPWLLTASRATQASRAAVGGFLLVLVVGVALRPPLWQGAELAWLGQGALASLLVLAVQRVTRVQAHLGAAADLAASRCDALTGLPNRGAIEDLLLGYPARQLRGLVVAVVGLNSLEQLEAERGEVFVARLHAHVARVLGATVREHDILGDLGGGEFVILLRGLEGRSARAVCERLRVRISARPLEGVNPSVNIGVAFYDDQGSGLSLLQAARQALAELHAGGMNRVLLALPEDAPGLTETQAMPA